MDSDMDRAQAAIEAAKAPTLTRMTNDVPKIPEGSLKKVFAFVLEHLFKDWLSIKEIKKRTKIRDNSLSSNFKAYLGKTLWQYIFQRRMEIADRLLRDLNLEVGAAGQVIGMTVLASFRRAFKRWCGELPSDVRGKKRAPEAGAPVDEEPAAPPSMLDGPKWERWKAAELWRQIRHCSFEEQRSMVEWYPFQTPALFDLLRRSSRQEGRKDRRRGVRVAELALLSLRRCVEAESDRGYELRALGLAELANARRLAADFTAAEGEFVTCWAEWEKPRQNRDPLIEAEICFLHGTLRMFQRRYEEALEMDNRSLSLSESEGDPRGQAQALIQRARIRSYIEVPAAWILDLRKAADLIDDEKDPFLAFGVAISLANGMARAEKYESSRQAIAKAKDLLRRLDLPLAMSEIEWVEGFVAHETGDLDEAQRLYLAARSRYLAAEEQLPTTLLSLDLTILYCDQQRYTEATELATEILPALQSLNLHPETLEAISILAKAVASREISQSLLRIVRDRIQLDPMSKLV